MQKFLLKSGICWMEKGRVPDFVTRGAIRRLCEHRLQQIGAEIDEAFLASLRHGPVALSPEKANEQHYQLPAEFFASVLGPRLKYSCCLWSRDDQTLAEAEEAALRETREHADLADGQQILELGCGWGSLTLQMAESYPNSRITAISNSASQRDWIELVAQRRGLTNLRVYTCDMNDFSPVAVIGSDWKFDRVVSIEMFEHMRNYQLLLSQIASWLTADGKLFVHLFCHRQHSYPFETDGVGNWMGQLFFSGGMMPSVDLLAKMGRELYVCRQWKWSGRHYQRTANAWLSNLDAQRDEVLHTFRQCYGSRSAEQWFHRWRTFFMAVSELFGFANGDEWFVSHYLMSPHELIN